MGLSVDAIRAELVGGGARPSLFRVYMSSNINPTADRKFQFLCKAAQIPGSTLGVIEVPYMGRKIKVAGDRTFESWNITVINDEDFKIRDAAESWMQFINGHVSNVTSGVANANPESYKYSAAVQQLSKTGSVLRTYQFYGVWPSDVSAIDLSWESVDTIEEFQITLNYDYWTVQGSTGTAGGTGEDNSSVNLTGSINLGGTTLSGSVSL